MKRLIISTIVFAVGMFTFLNSYSPVEAAYIPFCYAFGDVNDDGNVNTTDYNMILNAQVETDVTSHWQALRSDLSADGEVNVIDAQYLLVWLGGGSVPPVCTAPAYNMAPCIPTGDIYAAGNDSMKVSRFDKLRVLEHSAGLTGRLIPNTTIGDSSTAGANGDVHQHRHGHSANNIDSRDALILDQYITGLISNFNQNNSSFYGENVHCPAITVNSSGANNVSMSGSQTGTGGSTGSSGSYQIISSEDPFIDPHGNINTTLTAPATVGSLVFRLWQGDCNSINNSLRQCSVSYTNDLLPVDISKNVTAEYGSGLPTSPTPTPTPPPGTCTLTPGDNKMQGCYYEMTDQRHARPVQLNNPSQTAPSGPNNGDYANNAPVGNNVTALEFNPVTNPSVPPNGPGPDWFTGVWEGRFMFKAGTYRFYTASDDGSILVIDGVQQPNYYWNNRGFGTEEMNEKTFSSQTVHDLKLYYYQGSGGSGVRLRWEYVGPSCTDTLPAAASNPFPANGATGVSVTTNLDWVWNSWGTNCPSNWNGYNVYFGTNNPPPIVVQENDPGSPLYNPPGNLAENTTYYWYIRKCNQGRAFDCTNSPTWSFTTAGPVASITLSASAQCGGSGSFIFLTVTPNGTGDVEFDVWREGDGWLPGSLGSWAEWSGTYWWTSPPQPQDVDQHYRVRGKGSLILSNDVWITTLDCGLSPDLVIVNNSSTTNPLVNVTGATISGDVVTAEEGVEVTFEFRTRNIGSASAGNSTTLVETFDGDNDEAEMSVGTLAANTSTGTQSHSVTWSTPGTYDAYFLADLEDDVNESNELNNDVLLTVEVVAAGALPDLQIVSFELREYDGVSCTNNPLDDPAAGDNICFVSQVTNIGDPFSGNIHNSFYADALPPACDATPLAPSATSGDIVGGLSTGETKPFNGGPVQIPTTSSGTATAQLHIDYTCEIQEVGDTEVSAGNWDDTDFVTGNHRSIPYTLGTTNWLQAINGDVGAVGSIDMSNRPAGEWQTNNLLIAGNILDASSQRWQVSGYNQSLVPAGGVYNYFANRFLEEAKLNPIDCTSGTIPAGFSYCGDGNPLIMSNISPPTNRQSSVVFVDGNISVDTNVNLGQASVVFLAKWDVTVHTTVDNIDGVYIAGERFNDCGELVGFCTLFDIPLVVNGSIYANRIFVDGYNRTLQSGGRSLTVNFAPRYLVEEGLRSLIGTPSIVWREVAP